MINRDKLEHILEYAKQQRHIGQSCKVPPEDMVEIMERLLNAGNSPVIPDTWIPVSERMPIDFEAVIAFDGDQVYGEAMYSSDDGFTIDGYEPCDRLKLQNVTHWMAPPAAPQEVSDA